jgi:hypothetical protein
MSKICLSLYEFKLGAEILHEHALCRFLSMILSFEVFDIFGGFSWKNCPTSASDFLYDVMRNANKNFFSVYSILTILDCVTAFKRKASKD